MSKRSPFASYHPKILAVVTGAATSVIAAIMSWRLLEAIQPLSMWAGDHAMPMTLGELASWAYQLNVAAARQAFLQHLLPDFHWFLRAGPINTYEGLAAVDLIRPLSERLCLSGFAGTAAGLAAYVSALLATPRQQGLKHLAGRQLYMDTDAARRANRAERRARVATGRGIWLCPGVRLAFERESRHILVVGGTGSGKTVIFWSWILQVLERVFKRGDQLLIHDSKGDYVAKFPTDNFILLAPHDARSVRWNIASDCRDPQAARELAARFIPESPDPTWSNGAREILTGIIIAQQKRWGMNWGFAEMVGTAFSTPRQLDATLTDNYPPAAAYIMLDQNGNPTKTSCSFLVTMRAHIAATIQPLASAWPTGSDQPAISLGDWLRGLDHSPQAKTIVVQRAAHLPILSTAWISAVVQTLANLAASSLLSDDPRRRIWLFLDEFPQLGKLEGFHQLLEKGRSRGICAVLGVQDPSQIDQLYGSSALKTWLSSISTKIIGRIEAGPSAQWACEEIFGKRDVAWDDVTESRAPIKMDGSGGGTTVSRSSRREVLYVVTPDQLERDVGRKDYVLRSAIFAFVVGIAGAAFRLQWPIIPMPDKRPSTIPAKWLQTYGPDDVARQDQPEQE